MSETAATPAAQPTPVSGGNRPAPTLAAVPNPAPEAGDAASKETSAPAPKTYRLKIGGTEREVSEQTYHAYAQKAGAADQMLAEAKAERAKAAAEAQALKEKFGKNWREALKELGHDPDLFLRRSILETYGAEEMSEEQRQLQQERTAREQAEAKLKDFEQQRLTAQQEAAQQRAVAEYQQTFVSALEKAGLAADPESPLAAYAIRRMAALEEANLDAGTSLAPEVLAEMVKADIAEEHRHIFGGLEGEPLLEMLGADVTKRITKALVARHEARRRGANTLGSIATAPTDPRTMPATPGRAVPVSLPPRDEANGRFQSREERRHSGPIMTAFIPASITGGR